MGNLDEVDGRLLVVFDGHCGFCNGSVRWLLRRDRWDRMRFVPFESPKLAGLLRRNGLGLDGAAADPSSMLVVRDSEGPSEHVFFRSDAVVVLLGELPPPWPALGAVLQWIPRPLRDLGYRLVARSRYLIQGRLETCPIPTAEERARFL